MRFQLAEPTRESPSFSAVATTALCCCCSVLTRSPRLAMDELRRLPVDSAELALFSTALPMPARAEVTPAASAAMDFSRALASRSEEHTSELQSPCNLVCRLLLEKKKHNTK